MFKPFKGDCINGCKDRWIVVRKGYCGPCNEAQKHRPNRNERNNSDTSNAGRTAWMRSPRLDIPKQNNRSQNKRLALLYVPKKKAKKKIQRRRKCTGELALYEKIIQVRGPFSQISGKELIGFDVRWFSHILTKGAYPRFRLKEENIVIKTPDEHFKWEFEAHKLRNLPEWKWVFELKEKLKQEYYATK